MKSDVFIDKVNIFSCHVRGLTPSSLCEGLVFQLNLFFKLFKCLLSSKLVANVDFHIAKVVGEIELSVGVDRFIVYFFGFYVFQILLKIGLKQKSLSVLNVFQQGVG